LVVEKAGQLAVSSKYKSEFIANMSHELRTPLNSLLILAEQLEENPDHNMTAAQVSYASTIRASGNDLLSLLNDILDLAKVESGTVTVELSDVPLNQLCGALLGEFEPVAQGKGLGFTVQLAPTSPEHIVTDSHRLRQILKNLLANAFKFTERGEVRVQVSVAGSGWSPETTSLTAAPSVLAFSVIDTGVGIDQEHQQRIFEEFAQGDGSTARLYGGTGLGLSISRELAGLLGGEITVASTPGKGSTFTVYLPLTRPATTGRAVGPMVVPALGRVGGGGGEAADWAKRRAQPALAPLPRTGLDQGALAGRKVLVVDDDFRNVFALTALLERAEAEVTIAESGAEAVASVGRSHDIDIVLMDIMMPVMDGYEAIRTIRALKRCRELPIIAVTGKVVPGERERCLAAGANDYVPKPIDTAELLAAILPWLPILGSAIR